MIRRQAGKRSWKYQRVIQLHTCEPELSKAMIAERLGWCKIAVTRIIDKYEAEVLHREKYRERRREYSRRQYARNREKILERRRNYYIANRERRVAYQRAYDEVRRTKDAKK